MGVVAVEFPEILFGKVMHGRLFPKRNHFNYSIYYLSIPLAKIDDLPIARNKFGLLSFYDRDHGHCDGSNLEDWARDLLKRYNIDKADGDITLICMPRILHYTFNPVSFWLCHDKAGGLRAVLCEVNNTFGERHTYMCAHADQRIIDTQETMKAEKVFHVSPLLEREGHYKFRFDSQKEKFSVWIDYFNAENKKQLVTSLAGALEPMDKNNLRKAFWGYPLLTFKAITLIHWQAIKLLVKGIKYISKPKQTETRDSGTFGIDE